MKNKPYISDEKMTRLKSRFDAKGWDATADADKNAERLANAIRTKRRIMNHAKCLPIFLSAFLLVGCLGQQARQNVLNPIIQKTWVDVKADINRGPTIPASLGEFDTAVASGDNAKLAPLVKTDWPELKAADESNVRASSLSPGVQDSRLELLKQFDEALQKISN